MKIAVLPVHMPRW